MTWRRMVRRRSGGLAGLAVVGLILAGCVNLPSGGTLRNVNPLLNSDVGSQIVLTPVPPGPQWSEQEIVAGFLVASGANPDDLSIARDYLTQAYAKAWHPQKASPSVIDTDHAMAQSQVPARATGGQTSYQVTVSSQHLESLVAAGKNEPGRLQASRGPAPYVFTFNLVPFEGTWRIASIVGPNGKPSDSILLLTDLDFERDYLPRNLYYLASGTPHALVPYPVYISAQTGQFGGVQQLVDAVRTLPPRTSNWLYGAIRTAFRGIRPAVQVQGTTAVVDLNGSTGLDQTRLEAIEAQLVWTLTYAPDSPGGTGINSVEVDIGHKSYPNLTPSQPQFTSWVPQGPSGPLYFQMLDLTGHPLLEGFTPSADFGSPSAGKTGGVMKFHGLVVGGPPAREPLPTGLGRGRFTATAFSPPTTLGVSYFAACRGTTAYVAPLLAITELESRELPGNCTSLSWDSQGDCWAIAGSDVFVLNATPTALEVRVVSVPAQQIAQSDNFVSLKVAPDGLRVAMIVRGKNGTSVYVSAITKQGSTVYLAQGGPMLTVGPDLTNPIALTWWDSDHLLVLDREHGSSQLFKVPLHGGEPIKLPTTPSSAISVTANDSFVAVGTRDPGRDGHPGVLVSHGLDGPWLPVGPGSMPTYGG